MSYVYLRSEPGLFTVGFYSPDGRFHAERDFTDRAAAGQHCAYLNGQLNAAGRVLTCVFCGHEYPQDTPASGDQVLVDHIRSCPAHPMRELEARHKRLIDAAYVMIDCSTVDEARRILETLKLMPQDNEDVRKAIGLVAAVVS